jgi:DNA repair protein RecO (recombination protein O)
MKHHIKKTQALILQTMDYRETSRIITAFSEDFGKVKFIAKGVQKPKSKMGAALQSIVCSEVVFYKKETKDMYLVKEAEISDFFPHIHSNLLRYRYGVVIADFLYNLLAPEQTSRTLFQYSVFVLKKLDTVRKQDLSPILASFLIKGSELLGFKIELDHCAVCGKNDFVPLYFSHGSGGLVCEKCTGTDDNIENVSQSILTYMKTLQKNEREESLSKHEFNNLFLLLNRWFDYHNHKRLPTLESFIRES